MVPMPMWNTPHGHGDPISMVSTPLVSDPTRVGNGIFTPGNYWWWDAVGWDGVGWEWVILPCPFQQGCR
jgi:hypothetical protein